MDIKRVKGKKLVLEIGPNVKPQAHYIESWKDAKVLTMDIDEDMKPDIVGDAGNMTYENLFDGILASHVLEHFPYKATMAVLNRWKRALVRGGELHILVPSWEWSARQVLSESPSKALHGHTFAGQVNNFDLHLNMFTMRWLRASFDIMNMKVTTAKTAPYPIMIDGEVMEADQHYIVGVKT